MFELLTHVSNMLTSIAAVQPQDYLLQTRWWTLMASAQDRPAQLDGKIVVSTAEVCLLYVIDFPRS